MILSMQSLRPLLPIVGNFLLSVDKGLDVVWQCLLALRSIPVGGFAPGSVVLLCGDGSEEQASVSTNVAATLLVNSSMLF